MKSNKLVIVGGVVLLVLLLMVLPIQDTVQANGNGVLGLSYTRTIRGDVFMAGVGLRGTGRGNIVIDSMPANAVVADAFLYWATIGDDNTYTSPTLEGQSVDGRRIGTSEDTCWSFASQNYVYRANVTSIVDGDGSYTISGLPDDDPATNDSQGASLVVIYSNPGDPMRTIVIKDGAVTLDFDDEQYTTTLSNFITDDPVTEARVGYIVGDGQAHFDGDIKFNGTTIATNVFDGDDGEYWDTVSYDVTNRDPDPQSTTSLNAYNQLHDDLDCLLWVATVFSVTTVELDLDEAAVLPVVYK